MNLVVVISIVVAAVAASIPMGVSTLWLLAYTFAILAGLRLWKQRLLLAHLFVWHPNSIPLKKQDKSEPPPGFYGMLDMRRKAQICSKQASDYSHALVLVPDHQFDLDVTIFANLKGFIARYIMKKKLALKMYWNDKFIDEIQGQMNGIPPVMPPSKDLLDFMNNECDFSCEHADGSFWDHLRFCYDYSAINYPSESPRVLLLHSILGVGTNLFPCPKEKIPQLEKLVDPVEMSHICAFPSILRLINNGSLLEAFRAASKPIKQLKRVKYHRVIDNQTMYLDGEQIFVQLNFQLIHLMDFLPAMDWSNNVDDPQLQVFIHWFEFMKEHQLIKASVDMGSLLQVSTSLLDHKGMMIQIKRNIFQRAVSKYSADIDHSLAFELIWD